MVNMTMVCLRGVISFLLMFKLSLIFFLKLEFVVLYSVIKPLQKGGPRWTKVS